MLETRVRTFADNTGGGGSGSTSTAGLVQSSLTINTIYPLSGGGNLSQDRTFFIMSGNIGQILTSTGGVVGGIAWVNSQGGASGAVYAPTGGFYVVHSGMDVLTNEKVLTAGTNVTITTDASAIYVNANTGAGGSGAVYAATGNSYVTMNFETDLTAEYRLVQSGNNITISTAGNLVIINATTGSGSGGLDRTIIGQSVQGTSATRYGAPYGSTLDASSLNVAQFSIPYTGSARNLYFAVQNAPGAAASGRAWNGLVMKPTLITALTCQIFEVQTAASDLTHTISFTSGDIVILGYERIGTTNAPGFMSMSFELYN